jgi:hypothetical protein
MKRHLPAGFGLILGFAALLSCAPQPVHADTSTTGCPPPVKHRVVAHVRHHWAHRYVAHAPYLAAWTPVCGSVARPCNVEHLTVPVQ